MKNILLLVSLLVFCVTGQAQLNREPDRYARFMKGFVKQFNIKEYTALAATASSSFLKSVPEKKLTTFLSGIRNDFGIIQAIKFKMFDIKGSAVYHTELEKTWFNFIIGLDDSNRIQRLLVIDPNYNEDLPARKNKTTMQLPFDSTWYVFWGGDTEDENYHVTNRAQKNAFDFVIRDTAGRSFSTQGKSNEDYYAFGKTIYSPCNGVIVSVTTGVPDNIPGKMNPAQLTGNSVIIRSDRNEYILMAHFRFNSITVQQGKKIKAGQPLGRCGNSGNSSEPHLHLHIMDHPDLKEGTGIKCFFTNILVNGKLNKRYSPRRGELIGKQ